MLAQFRKHKELISKSSIPCLFLNFFTTLGMDKTIQRGDLGKHGILFKIVPMHSEMKPSNKDFMSCWYKPVPKWLPRAGQSVIPTNLSEFKVRTDKLACCRLCCTPLSSISIKLILLEVLVGRECNA